MNPCGSLLYVLALVRRPILHVKPLVGKKWFKDRPVESSLSHLKHFLGGKLLHQSVLICTKKIPPNPTVLIQMHLLPQKARSRLLRGCLFKCKYNWHPTHYGVVHQFWKAAQYHVFSSQGWKNKHIAKQPLTLGST